MFQSIDRLMKKAAKMVADKAGITSGDTLVDLGIGIFLTYTVITALLSGTPLANNNLITIGLSVMLPLIFIRRTASAATA